MLKFHKQQEPEDPQMTRAHQIATNFKGRSGDVTVEGVEYSYKHIEFLEGYRKMYLATVTANGKTMSAKDMSLYKAYAIAIKHLTVQ